MTDYEKNWSELEKEYEYTYEMSFKPAKDNIFYQVASDILNIPTNQIQIGRMMFSGPSCHCPILHVFHSDDEHKIYYWSSTHRSMHFFSKDIGEFQRELIKNKDKLLSGLR